MIKYTIIGQEKINGRIHTFIGYTKLDKQHCSNYVKALNDINQNPAISFHVGKKED